jgi:hypothetical protein
MTTANDEKVGFLTPDGCCQLMYNVAASNQ